MDVPFELWGQRGWPGVDIVGESHYADAIRDLFGGEFRSEGCELTAAAQLVPEPWNRHDRNAVGVWVAGRQVGYLPREQAGRYAPVLSELVAQGWVPQVSARVWAAADYGDRPGLTGSVRIDLAEPHLIAPANRAPGAAHRVLPTGNAIQVAGEEEHLDALLPWLREEGECWVHVTLHEVHEQLARSTRELIEVRLEGVEVGRLSPRMSGELLPAVRHLAGNRQLTAARAVVRGNRIKVEVVVHAARAHELADSWLAVSGSPPDVTVVGVGGSAATGRPEAGTVTVERAAAREGADRPAGVATPVVIPGAGAAGPAGHAPSPAATTVLAAPDVPARHGVIPPRPAGVRFVVPPGWPQPPDGWTPPAGWRPDPAWPPAPADWQWWVLFWQ
jgi:HIRAN domain-containing protein